MSPSLVFYHVQFSKCILALNSDSNGTKQALYPPFNLPKPLCFVSYLLLRRNFWWVLFLSFQLCTNIFYFSCISDYSKVYLFRDARIVFLSLNTACWNLEGSCCCCCCCRTLPNTGKLWFWPLHGDLVVEAWKASCCIQVSLDLDPVSNIWYSIIKNQWA